MRVFFSSSSLTASILALGLESKIDFNLDSKPVGSLPRPPMVNLLFRRANSFFKAEGENFFVGAAGHRWRKPYAGPTKNVLPSA